MNIIIYIVYSFKNIFDIYFVFEINIIEIMVIFYNKIVVKER